MIVFYKEISNWVMDSIGKSNDNMTAIGEVRDGMIIAGVAFESYNGSNMIGHQRIISPPSRKFWINVADYIFNQAGCKRFTAMVHANNEKAIKLNLHIGFVIEATLKDAGPNCDLLVMTLWRENCKILKWIKK